MTTTLAELLHFIVTDQGPRRRMEDSAHVEDGMLVVCDGMGGEEDGHLASAAAVEWARTGLPLDRLKNGVSRHVEDAAGRRSGTTFTLARRRDDQHTLEWLHCGDTVLWLLHFGSHTGSLQRITRGHTVWDVLRATRHRVDRYYKSSLTSCIPERAGGMTWDEGLIDVPLDGEAWLFGTTDGFHDGCEEPDGRIDEDLLLSTLCRFLQETPEQAQESVKAFSRKTQDNATLVGLRLR